MPGRELRLYFGIIGVLPAAIGAWMNDPNDSTVINDTGSWVAPNHEERVWNPVVTGAFSAVIPGGGQFYTGHYVKSGSFLALEVITALVANFWYRQSWNNSKEADIFKENAKLFQDAANIYYKWSDSMKLAGNETFAARYADSASKREAQALEKEGYSALLRFDAKNARYKMYNAISWMVGGYIYNIFDGIGCSRFFFNDKQKNPAKAAWLSAIPALGLGQMYNGSFSKAGLIMMTQVSMGVLAINYHRLMNDAQSHFTAGVDSGFNQDWEVRRSSAFRNRNTWLWYSLAFYFYGILDAVVDAHLHDYNSKIRAYPDLVPGMSALRINVDYRF